MEIVQLNKKIVVGKSIVTSNIDPKMGDQIGQLWSSLYAENGYYGAIKNRMGGYAIGLYSDYMDDLYTLTVGAEVSKAENPEFNQKIIPAGKYAKFSVHGDMVKDVQKAWETIWATKLDRTFTGDFEEYLPCDHCEHMDNCNVETCNDCYINIFIAIK